MDWKSILARLARSGLTQMRVAELCDVRQSTISALARGETTSPSFALGTRLLQLADSMPDKSPESRDAESQSLGIPGGESRHSQPGAAEA